MEAEGSLPYSQALTTSP